VSRTARAVTHRRLAAILATALAAAVLLPACQREPEPTAAGAVALVQEHYRKINERKFQEAYADWGDSGRASGKTFVEFLNGYVQTERVEVTPGEPGRIEGAAGSRYVTVPVRLSAHMVGGGEQDYAGTYTLRYSVIEGAKPRWRWVLYKGEIERTAPADSTS
jgi:hypothetical protein